MTGNQDADRIPSDRTADRLCRHLFDSPLSCDFLCDRLIGRHFPIWDAFEDLHHLPTKRGQSFHSIRNRSLWFSAAEVLIQPFPGMCEDRQVFLCKHTGMFCAVSGAFEPETGQLRPIAAQDDRPKRRCINGFIIHIDPPCDYFCFSFIVHDIRRRRTQKRLQMQPF